MSSTPKPFVRESVWANGGDFDDPILKWYALGVRELKTRPIADPTSWRFLGAIHGINERLWTQYGYLSPGEPMPDPSTQASYWNQCQHQTWYFLPWHRGYLISLEKNVRDAIVAQGGPKDWALPYWNYSDTSDPKARDLPPAFSRETMPDGSPNPLYVEQRYGAAFGTLPLPEKDVTLGALREPRFVGVKTGGSPGFGGVETGFSHSGSPSGALESKPHNIVHVDVGQSKNGLPGLMAYPPTAALDPIFYLHHANIDRLWEVWIARDPSHTNPTAARWLKGPIGRGFIMPMPDGSGWSFSAEDVLEPELDYRYSDTSDPLGGQPILAARFEKLNVAPPPSASMPDDTPPEAELIGANADRVPLRGTSTQTRVQLADHGVRSVADNLRSAVAAKSASPSLDRVFLNLENIRSKSDHVVIDVFVEAPGAEEHHAGTFSLFGAQRASDPDAPHGGHGLTEVLEITDLVDELFASDGLDDLAHLEVHLRPRNEVTDEDDVSVGRVSVFRHA